jgi:hypothetical protein
MLLTVFRVPTETAARGLRIVEAFLDKAVGEFDHVSAATVEELRVAWAGIKRNHVLCSHELPSSEMISFLREASAPMLLFVDDPVSVASELQARRGYAHIHAARVASISASVLEEILVAPDVMLISAHRYGTMSLRQFLGSLASYLAVAVSDRQLDSVAQELAGSFGCSVQLDKPWMGACVEGSSDTSPMDDDRQDRLSFERKLQFYQGEGGQHPLSRVVWPAEVFVHVDSGDTPLAGKIDLTGPQRPLINGPWFGLPRGRWRASIEFEVSSNMMGCVMNVNVVGGRLLRQGRFELPESGNHSCALDFNHDDARSPIMLQFFLERAVLQGEFRLVQIILERARRQLEGGRARR